MATIKTSSVLKGDKELKKMLKDLDIKGDRELRREIKRTSTGIKNHYKRDAKRHSWTGELEDSIKADTKDNWKSSEIGSTKKQSYWLEFGRKAFSAKSADYLTFRTRDGSWHRVKKVAAAPAHPHLLMAWMEWMVGNKFADRLKKRFDRIK